MRFFLFLAVLFTVLFCGGQALAAPYTTPQLRVESGVHSATITRCATDATGQLVATASDDKTVRLWDARNGELLHTYRLPVGPGSEGNMYAVAVHPAGELIAAAGWVAGPLGNCIFLLSRQSGQVESCITSLSDAVYHLAWSRDGRRLAAGLAEKGGLRRYEKAAGNWRQITADTSYPQSIRWLDWDATGRIVTSCDDGYIRLHDSAGRQLTRALVPETKRPNQVAFSPDGQAVAVGSIEGAVAVLASNDLQLRHRAAMPAEGDGSLNAVGWSTDNATLYAGGTRSVNGINPLWAWSEGGRGRPRQVDIGCRQTLMCLVPLPAGGFVWASAEPAWGVVGADHRFRVGRYSLNADFRLPGPVLRVARDGTAISFGYNYKDPKAYRFALDERVLKPLAGDDPALSPPRTQAAGLTLSDFQRGHPQPRLNGRVLPLMGTDYAFCGAVDEVGQRAVVAGWYIYCFDPAGKLLWDLRAPDLVWQCNITGNGRYLVAAIGDGTVRWFRMQDGREMLALFPHVDRARWVLWTPAGYYDASPGGEDLIGWVFNRGLNVADYFGAARFRDTFYRPQVVAQILPMAELAANLQSLVRPGIPAAAAAEEGAKEALRRQPPVVQILSPGHGSISPSANVVIRYTVRTPSGVPVREVRALVNGRPAATARDLRLVAVASGMERSLTLTLPDGESEVSVLAENEFATSEPATIRLKRHTLAPAAFTIKPKLYVLAVGISDYQDATLKLSFAGKDARDFVTALRQQKGLLYRDVEAKVLTDGEATRDALLDGLEWIQRQTTQKDVAMVFLSGHGTNDENNRYYFLPADFKRERFRSTTVPFSEIQNTVQVIAGKVLFFVDSCHSGNVMGTGQSKGPGDINRIINELSSAENGAVVFSASTGRQVAWEDEAWQNGAFAKSVIEGLRGEAARLDPRASGRITVKMLDFYISERVKELTGGRQTPTTQIPPTVPDFPVALAPG